MFAKEPSRLVGSGSRIVRLYFDDHGQKVDIKTNSTGIGHWQALLERHRVDDVLTGATVQRTWELAPNNILFYLKKADKL